jgi:hypothetical protein
MKLRLLEGPYAVCKAEDFSQVDYRGEFLFLAKTDEEFSIVCQADQVPANTTAVELGWRAFRIEGQLDFSLIGILARISAILADRKIGIYVISTFNTDYILVKSENLAAAIDALGREGYVFA